jgi:hypothetical protein
VHVKQCWLPASAAAALLLGCGQPTVKPLSGKLTVLVRPPDRNVEPVPIAQPGAAPVQSGGAMCLDAKLDEPAFIYIVWIDSEGKILPLYPWNNERLEVTDIRQPPPLRRATKLIFSPQLSHNWTFNDQPGIETVILLARRTALPEETKLADLLNRSTALQPAQPPQSVAEARLDSTTKVGAKSTPTNDPALTDFLRPLQSHFDLIHAVQFTHSESLAASESTSR